MPMMAVTPPRYYRMQANQSLSALLIRIGMDLIASSETSYQKYLSEIDALRERYRISDHIADETYLLLCVMYVSAVKGHELGLPTGPQPAYVFLRAAFKDDAFDMNGNVFDLLWHRIVKAVEYDRQYVQRGANRAVYLQYYYVIELTESFIEDVALIDAGEYVVPLPEREGNFNISYGGQPRPASDEEEDYSPDDPDYCPVFIIADAWDVFTVSEFRQIWENLEEKPDGELLEMRYYLKNVWCNDLDTKEGRNYIRNHEVFRFSFFTGGIVTHRLYELGSIIDWHLEQRRIRREHFYS